MFGVVGRPNYATKQGEQEIGDQHSGWVDFSITLFKLALLSLHLLSPVPTVLFRELVRFLHHALDFFLGQAALLGSDRNVLHLTRCFIFRRNLAGDDEHAKVVSSSTQYRVQYQ